MTGVQTCALPICRVASRGVVLDYPSATSLALVQSLARKVLHPFKLSSEPYRVFLDGHIRTELEAHGFHIVSVHRQFVLPIALHKTVGSRRFTESTERWLARVGLLRCGSPVTIYAERG